jgi:hypothetical protein
MEDRSGEYTATFVPVPNGPYEFDKDTLEFIWTPVPQDAGESFTLTFEALFNKIRANPQVNEIKVSSGPVFRKIGEWPGASPLSSQFILVDSLVEGQSPKIILVGGNYWQGDISVFEPTGDGLNKLGGASNGNHPVGAGVITAGAERWVCIADYWTSRLRNFALRNGSLSEMAVSTELPGKPVLAGFDRDRSLSAVLCRTRDGFSVHAYRQEGQLQSKQVGNWSVPDDLVWRKLLVKPAAEEDSDDPPVFVLVGADFANGIYILEAESGAVRNVRTGGKGVIIDAIPCRLENRIYCLVAGENGTTVETVELTEFPEEGKYPSVMIDKDPVLCGFGAVNFSGASGGDLVALSATRAGIAFGGGTQQSSFDSAHFWAMPVPGRLFGKVAVYPGGGGNGETVIFVDNDGGVWSLGLTDR